MPQLPSPQIADEPMYREQTQNRDWPMLQQQSPPQINIKQSNSVWPEKLLKPSTIEEKVIRRKGQRDSDYSEEYVEEGQAEGEEVTTTEAPKKVMIVAC